MKTIRNIIEENKDVKIDPRSGEVNIVYLLNKWRNENKGKNTR